MASTPIWTLVILLQLTGSKMTDSPAPAAESPFKLSGEQYWADPMGLPHVREYASALARQTNKGQGIQLDAPSKIYRDKHKTVPLLVLHSNSFANLDYFTLDRTAQVVTSHLET